MRETGADGVEITASKGYVLQQFLNPAVNHRADRYGGSVEKRFQLLKEVVTETRAQIGDDRLLGVRLSANDCNNHPVPEVKMFFNSTRHLSFKAAVRASVLNAIPDAVTRKILGVGWTYQEAANLADAKRFKDEVGLPVIANGGLQHRSAVQAALESGSCDFVSMARPLLANPDLPEVFRSGRDVPERPCTFCNRCALRTTLFPVGCYEPKRYDSVEEMEATILALSGRPRDDA